MASLRWAWKLSLRNFLTSFSRTANWSEATLNTRRHSFGSLFRGKSSKEILGSKKILCWWWPIPIINFCELLGVSFSIPPCSDWGWSWLSEPNLSGTCFALVQLLKHNEKLKDAKERAQRRLQNYMICHLFFSMFLLLCVTQHSFNNIADARHLNHLRQLSPTILVWFVSLSVAPASLFQRLKSLTNIVETQLRGCGWEWF